MTMTVPLCLGRRSQPALVVPAIMMADYKSRPAVIFAERSGGWLVCSLTTQKICRGYPTEAFHSDEVELLPTAFLYDGFISNHPMQVLKDDQIDWGHPIGRVRRSFGERIVDVHGHEGLTISEIDEFLWGCVQ